MQSRVSIFLSGKMISVGTKSETKVYEELKLTKQFLLERDFAKSVALNFKTQNIVVTARL